LYVCATPIGNIQDCSFRLIQTLKNVDIVAAEDTRVTVQLLKHYGIDKKLMSLQKYNEGKRIRFLIDFLKSGQSVALVSDAGTPGISDPGAYTVSLLREEGFPIVGIPGPCSLTLFLSVSGLHATSFHFTGFFPKDEKEGVSLLQKLEGTMVSFETSKRLYKTLSLLNQSDRITQLVLAKELTKKFENIIQGSVEECMKYLDKNPPKGEWVLGATLSSLPVSYDQDLGILLKYRLNKKQILGIAKDKGWPKNKIYSYLEGLEKN